jgi:molybdopterin/thiamine biosynthesis adenylyltransferase
MNMSGSLVICGVDNGETRIAVSNYYRKLAVPVIFIAVDLFAECGYVFVQESLPNSACFGCAFPNTLQGRKAPCFVPSSKDILKVTAGLALYAADSLLMERNRNWNYRLIHLAGYAPDVSLSIEKNSNCPLCSSKEQGSPGRAT